MKNYISEFKEYLKGLNEQLQLNEAAKELYYGFYVFDGPKIQNPDILFIGINPGNGNKKDRKYEVKIQEGERNSYLEFLDGENNGYVLASDFVTVMEMTGKSKLQIEDIIENKSVKMNQYSIITNDADDIEKCVKNLGKSKWIEYHHLSMTFVLDVIRDIKPKIVILEGKGVHDNFIVDIMNFKNVWDVNTGVGYLKSDEFNTHFISYNRNRGNKFDKQVFAERLKTLL